MRDMAMTRGTRRPSQPTWFERHRQRRLMPFPPRHRHPVLLADLLALRTEVLRFNAQRWPGVTAPDSATLNARNQHLLDQAAAAVRFLPGCVK